MGNKKPGEIHILVVDDEEAIRDVLYRAIKQAGYDCLTAENTNEALGILEKKNFDIVITDIVMPGTSGIDLMENSKKKHNADFIVITGFSDGMQYENIIEKGAKDFIKKPFAIKELLVRIDRIIWERNILSEQNQTQQELIQSLNKLERILQETVNALGSTLESRDPYTAGHQQRVTSLAVTIAKKMGLSEKQINGIQIAGLLHDIGKISIPIDILNKPRKLTTNEFNFIMEHSQTGYEILKNIEFEQPIAEIVLQHHEKMNASGYPNKLSGKDILLEARILTVADVTEAISSHRPYRPALGIEKALEEISQNKGTLFDANVVDTCLKLFTDKGYEFS